MARRQTHNQSYGSTISKQTQFKPIRGNFYYPLELRRAASYFVADYSFVRFSKSTARGIVYQPLQWHPFPISNG